MNQETKVGLFLLAALAIILPGALFLGNVKLFQRTDGYFIDFADVEALPPKAAVKIAGVEIGKVSTIRLIKGRARVKINIDPDITLYQDAVARVGSTGVIGTRFVELLPGSADLVPLKPGAILRGMEGSSLNSMISKLTTLFEQDPKYGNSVDNLKATLANIRQVTEALNGAIGQRERELTDIVLNIRTFTGDLKDLMRERKDDLNVAFGKIKNITEKLDSILGKIDRGEGTIGALVSDEKTATQVKEAIASIKDTAKSAKKVIGRFTLINTYWNYRYRYDFRDDEGRSDVGITFVPRPGKFYAVGVTNLGEMPRNEKTLEFERKNRITAVMGADFGPFTGYVGAIRSDGGVGLNFRPFWFSKKWERRFSLDFEAADFDRDRTVRGRRLDSTWTSAGARLALKRWLWIGARVEDILERSVFMANVNVIFRDEDLAYLLGFASVAR